MQFRFKGSGLRAQGLGFRFPGLSLSWGLRNRILGLAVPNWFSGVEGWMELGCKGLGLMQANR